MYQIFSLGEISKFFIERIMKIKFQYYEYQNDGMVECPDPIINEGQKGINYVINYNFHAQSNCHQKIEPITG